MVYSLRRGGPKKKQRTEVSGPWESERMLDILNAAVIEAVGLNSVIEGSIDFDEWLFHNKETLMTTEEAAFVDRRHPSLVV